MQGMKRRNSESEPLGNIWDVVSSLAQALTSARDQLVGLISFTGSKGSQNAVCVSGRGQGKENTYHGRGQGKENIYHGDGNVPRHNERARYQGSGYIGGGGYQGGSKKPSNVHRQHARGHVAFGNHSEFKPKPPGASRRARSPGRGGKKGAQFRSHMGPNSNPLHIKTKKGADCPPRCDKDKNCKLRPPSPGSKRHCVGTQFAVSLREEACRMRERQLAEEKESKSKPKWSRY